MDQAENKIVIKGCVFRLSNIVEVGLSLQVSSSSDIRFLVNKKAEFNTERSKTEYLLHIIPRSGICSCIEFDTNEELWKAYIDLKSALGGLG